MDIRRQAALPGDNRQLRYGANLHRDPSHGSLAPNLEVTGHSPKNSSLTCSGNTLLPAISRTALKRASQGASTIKGLLWQRLVRFTQIQCNWLRPGGTPGSNILIKLICEILTMWVFRWLVIWCERSLCFHWKGTGEAGTCFGETLQKIITVELSWVRAITNDSVCLPPHESQILHHLFLFFCQHLLTACQTIFFHGLLLSSAICSGWFTTLINLIIIMCLSQKMKRSMLLQPDVLFFSYLLLTRRNIVAIIRTIENVSTYLWASVHPQIISWGKIKTHKLTSLYLLLLYWPLKIWKQFLLVFHCYP